MQVLVAAKQSHTGEQADQSEIMEVATRQDGRADRDQRKGIAVTELQRSGDDKSATDAKSVRIAKVEDFLKKVAA